MNLVPAYGRDYKSAAAVKQDFYDGKDFIVASIVSKWVGKPCSIRDFEDGQYIEVRYAKERKVTCFTVKK
jgi:hypothetical protein